MSAPTTAEDQPLVYTVRTAARLADCSESTIRRAIEQGHLASIEPTGTSLLRIPRKALNEWLGVEG